MTRFPRLLFAAAATLALPVGAAFAYLVDAAVHAPASYYTFLPPARGASYTDSVYGTAIKRISDSRSTADAAAGGTLELITNEYSTMSPFNLDATRLLLQHGSYFALYDGTGNFIKSLPFEVHASAEPRWSRQNAALVYFVNGNQLKQLNVSTDAISVVHSFNEYGTIRGHGESDICFDGNHFVFSGDNRYIFVYEISTDRKGPVLDTAGRGFDQIYIAPDDTVLVGWLQPGSGRYNGLELYDRNMNFLRQITRAIGHMDVTRDVDGSSVVVWANAADPQPICNAAVVKVRLSDARQTCLMSVGWEQALHVSGPDGNGWVFVSTYNPGDPNPASSAWPAYTNEILQVKLDGTEIRRLAHHRSRPLNGYWYSPRASVSRDGRTLVFSSNFGLQQILGLPTEYSDVYMMTVPASGSPSPSPTPTPAPSPTPTPGPSPTPTPPPSGTVRVQEDNPAVSFTGNWSPHTHSMHSGSGAMLALEKGSQVKLTFTGTGVSWIGYRDEWSGIARVYLDGVYKGAVDTYASPARAQSVLYSTSGLAAGAHTLVIEVTETSRAAAGSAWVWIDAFDVSQAAAPPPPPPPPPPAASWKRFEQATASVTYTGGWSPHSMAAHSGGSAVLSATTNARATFTFTGTGVRWLAYRDEWSGKARVYVDGVLKGTVDTYATPAKAQAATYSLTGLASRPHTLTIEVAGTKRAASGGTWVWVDAFEALN
jgi:hypothetical protein